MFIYNEKNEVIDFLTTNDFNRAGWDIISLDYQLSEDFMRKYKNKLAWWILCQDQQLSESFMREMHDCMEWDTISSYQVLSENFIRDFKNKLSWTQINRYQKLSNKFRKEFVKYLSMTKPLTNNWINNPVNNKLRYIKKNGIDKIYPLKHDQNGWYLTAYKSVRSDFCSVYNHRYVYHIGKTYISSCNCDLDSINSFGLAAWTKEEALNYHSKGKLLLVKIYLKDLGAIVHDKGKLRAFKLTVLEEVKI
jgi:hypothetical protein